MARYFYDTEFLEDGSTIELISIGIVADDGREFYTVSADFDQHKLLANPWLAANVWPSLPTTEPRQYRDRLPPHGWLDTDHPDVRPRAQIANAVRSFILGDHPDELPYVELWADYCAYDHVALCQLYGTMMDLPEGMPMFTHDVQHEASRHGLSDKDLPQQESGLHNALADARHTKACVDYLRGLELAK